MRWFPRLRKKENEYNHDHLKDEGADHMENGEIRWIKIVPITKNPDWMKILGIAFASPYLLIFAMMLLNAPGMPDTTTMLYFLLIATIVLLLCFWLALWFLKNKYEVEYVLDDAGAVNRFTQRQARTNAGIINASAMIGLAATLAGKTNTVMPRSVSSQQEKLGSISWQKVKRIKYIPEKYAIYLRKGSGSGLSLFCNEENYSLVEAMVKEHTAHAEVL